MNDKSLVYGGRFDPPHVLHRAGFDVDIGDPAGRVALVISKDELVDLAQRIWPGVQECHAGRTAIHFRVFGRCR